MSTLNRVFVALCLVFPSLFIGVIWGIVGAFKGFFSHLSEGVLWGMRPVEEPERWHTEQQTWKEHP